MGSVSELVKTMRRQSSSMAATSTLIMLARRL